ncbi:DUF29 domain-containing protein [Aphanizomenon flos-aquae]|nr:DUF29 domain-containing protein [Aphanizomenon flos-aquae]
MCWINTAKIYPLDLPFTLEQLLDEDFYGDML